MNKKGFTLIELLAVIIILVLLALLVGTSIVPLVKDSKKDLSEVQIKAIESAAEAWSGENLDRLPENGECIYITLEDLKETGFLEESIMDLENNVEINNDIKIKISANLNNAGKTTIDYEFNPEDTSECSYSYSE